MSYVKTQWVNNTTPINDTNLNKIEQGIYDNSLVVDAVTNKLNPRDTETYKTAELTEGQITDVIGVSDIVIKGQTSQDGEPTPSSPVDVNVVSGSNMINTSNKNLCQIQAMSTINGGYINRTCGIFGKVIKDITYTLSFKNNSNYTSSGEYRVYKENDSTYTAQGTKSLVANSRNAYTFTAVATGYLTLNLKVSTDINNLFTEIQLEQGSTATTYEPHQGKELPLDLGSIELCKIGNYQDYFYKSGSKWYLHKEIGKIVLNGTESGGWNLRETNTNTIRITADGLVSPGILAYSQVYSKVFKGYSSNADISNIDIPSIAPRDTGSGFTVRFPVSIATTVDGFKAWLSSNLPFVYYATSNITNTEITDTILISQLEAIYNAPLYEETNITQTNNDLPMVLDITACKDNINGIKAFIRK